jgi:hypothetical protein
LYVKHANRGSAVMTTIDEFMVQRQQGELRFCYL